MLKISSIDLQQIQFEENFANLSIIVFFNRLHAEKTFIAFFS